MILNLIFKFLVSLFCVMWILKNVVLPISVYFFYSEKYILLSSACANAMDESWFSDQYKDGMLESSSKVHLLVCHEYDKTRKIMLFSGIDENVLSYLGLEALEINQHSAEKLVEQHRFRER